MVPETSGSQVEGKQIVSPESIPDDAPWFAGKDLQVWIYRVNRRPAGTLFDEPLTDLEKHFQLNLEYASEVTTGRRYQREWRIGNVQATDDAAISGRLGWYRHGEQITNVWDDKTKAWVDTVVTSDTSAAAPFWLETGTRFLGVLRHPSFKPRAVSQVLAELLNAAERRRAREATGGLPVVIWAVDPVVDEQEFRSGVERTDAVRSVQFVFERPNPDAEEEFAPLFARMNALKAELIAERIAAQDDRTGLDKEALLNDETSKGYIAAAKAAFGYIVARGRRGSKKVRFDQRQNLMSETTDTVGVTWSSATTGVGDAVRRAERRAGRG